MNNDNSHENNIPTELTGPVLVNQDQNFITDTS